MTLSSLRALSMDDIPGAPKELEPFVSAVADFQEQATSSLDRKLLVGELATFDFVHGVESAPIKVPEGFDVEGISSVGCRGLTVDSAGKFTGLFYSLGIARLDWRPVQKRNTKGRHVAVTAYFAPPPGIVNIRSDATQVIATATITATTFDTDDQAVKLVGTLATVGALSYDLTAQPTRITCRDAGFLLLTGSIAFPAGGAAGVRHMWFDKNASGARWGFVAFELATRVALPIAARVPVSAGDYVQLYGYQASGGNLTIEGATDGPRFQARYEEPAASAKGRVTLRFDGGS